MSTRKPMGAEPESRPPVTADTVSRSHPQAR